MNIRRVLIVLFVLLCVGVVAAEPAGEVRDTADRLAASIYTGPAMRTLRQLSDGFGGRLSRSPAYNHAAEWAAAQFRSYGIQNARLEPFTIPNGWVRGTAHGQMRAPISHALHLESLGWSPSTPPRGVTGEVVIVDDVSADHIQGLGDKLRGKIVFLDISKIFVEGWVKVLPSLEASYQLFKNAGAIALVFPDRDRNNVLNATEAGWGASVLALPGAQIGMEDWQFIRRSLDGGPVTVQFELENKISGATQVNNVVAEIRGSELPDQWILIGAHLDSWDYGTGAQDNGTGSVMVLDVARAIASLGKAPRRSIRFALWAEKNRVFWDRLPIRSHTSAIWPTVWPCSTRTMAQDIRKVGKSKIAMTCATRCNPSVIRCSRTSVGEGSRWRPRTTPTMAPSCCRGFRRSTCGWT